MSEHHITTTRRDSRWRVPGLAVVCGLAYLGAGLASGDHAFGFTGLGLMVGVAALMLLLAPRSEMVAGLLDRKDERINSIDRDATLFSGMTVLVAILLAFVIEMARGQDGQPYATLGAIGGVTYLAALVVLRFRR
jgi:hypothetical protein